MRYLRTILLSLTLMMTLIVSGQEFQVRSFRLAENDISAVKYQRLDLNGQPCALIKVGLGVQGAKFPSTEVVGDVKFDTGEYWVYVVEGTKKLKVMHNNYAPLYIDFSNYPEQRLEGGRTYVLILVGLNLGNVDKVGKTVDLSNISSASNASSSDNKSHASSNVLPITVKGVTFNMVKVDGGTFTMGATSEQVNPDKNEKPTHQVTLSSYYIGETEVTQALWTAVMGNNPSYFKGNKLPVEMVSWEDCQTFIGKLNDLTGKRFRLPTEAEWEYAARGGNRSNHTQYSGGSMIDDVAWYYGNSGSKTHSVKTKKPNELGLYNMSGNVWEWCQDWKGSYSSNAQTNPTGPDSGSDRVFRGGTWSIFGWFCRSSFRGKSSPGYRYDTIGFRLALSE